MHKPTEEEIQKFHEDVEAPNHTYLGKHHVPCEKVVFEEASPLFGEDFRKHMIRRLERETNPVEARKTYNAIEQETVTYVANFIKDSIVAAFKKIKRR